MATPKLKVYKLSRGYSEDADDDIQQSTSDELLPIVDKNTIPDDALYLKGVTARTEVLTSLGSNITEILTVTLDVMQLTSFPLINSGFFVPVFTDIDGVIDSVEYTVNSTTGAVTFTVTPNGNVSTNYWMVGGASSTTWMSTYYPIYSGLNYMFRDRVVDTSLDLYTDAEYTLTKVTGLYTFTVSIIAPTATYYQETSDAFIFVSDFPNWVTGMQKTGASTRSKLRTNPDVFKGIKDYPGDDSEDELGTPIIQGAIPEWQEIGFQIDYRKGIVIFSEEVDSVADPVRANFAYYKGIDNATSQVLELTSTLNGYTYKAVNEKFFPNSHDKRWVTRNISGLMPINFYDGGIITPQLLTVSPYSVLTTRQINALVTGGTYDLGTSYVQHMISFSGLEGEQAIVIVNGVSYIVSNMGGEFVWDLGGAGQYLFTTIGESITRTADNYQFSIVWNGIGSFVFTIDDFVEIVYSSSSSSISASSISNSSSSGSFAMSGYGGFRVEGAGTLVSDGDYYQIDDATHNDQILYTNLSDRNEKIYYSTTLARWCIGQLENDCKYYSYEKGVSADIEGLFIAGVGIVPVPDITPVNYFDGESSSASMSSSSSYSSSSTSFSSSSTSSSSSLS